MIYNIIIYFIYIFICYTHIPSVTYKRETELSPVPNTLEKWSSCSHEVGFLSTQRQESFTHLFIQQVFIYCSIIT